MRSAIRIVVSLVCTIALIASNGIAQEFEVEIEKEKKEDKEKQVKEARIVVTGTRTKKRLKDVVVRTELVTKEDIENSGAKNMFEVLDKGLIPGVTVNTSCTNCNFSEVRMQGLEGGYTLMLFDGLPIFSSLAGVYGLRQIHPANIDRIEVVKGAASALYGSSALGGVINIITREPEADKPILSASYKRGVYEAANTAFSWDADGTAGIRQGDVAIIVTGSKHHNDYVLTNDDEYTDMVEQDSQTLSAKTHIYFLNDSHRLTFTGRSIYEFRRGGYTGQRSRMIDHDEDPGTPDIEIFYKAIDDPLDADAEHIRTDRWEYGVGYRAIFPAGNSLDINYLQSRHMRDATNAERAFYSEEDISIVDLVYSHTLFGFNTITLGGNWKSEDLAQIINYQKDEDKKSKIAAGFIQDEIKILKIAEIVVGVRYDDVYDSNLYEDSAWSPRTSVKLNLTEDLSIRSSWGMGFKVPGLFAEDLHLCSAAPQVNVPDDLKSEKSQSYTGSIAYVTDVFNIDVTVFRTTIKDKISLEFDDPPAGYDASFRNVGDAATQGVETNVSVQLLKPLRIFGSYTYTLAEYDTKRGNPADPNYDNSDNILRTPEQTARFGFELTEKQYTGISLFASGRYTGRQYAERVMVADGNTYIDHTDGYFVYDAKVQWDIDYGEWIFSAFFGVDNITNETQERIYSAEDEESAAYIYAPLTGRYIYGGAKMSL